MQPDGPTHPAPTPHPHPHPEAAPDTLAGEPSSGEGAASALAKLQTQERTRAAERAKERTGENGTDLEGG